MKECTVVVAHEVGLHARPAAQFVKLAKQFTSTTLTITNMTRDPQKIVDAKSLIALIKIACAQGHSVRIVADGGGEEAAITALSQFVGGGGESTEK